MADWERAEQQVREQENLARIAQTHKRAFRDAYEFLERSWPPNWDNAYWDGRCADLQAHEPEHAGDRLYRELMLGIYSYLEKIVKQELQRGGDGADGG